MTTKDVSCRRSHGQGLRFPGAGQVSAGQNGDLTVGVFKWFGGAS